MEPVSRLGRRPTVTGRTPASVAPLDLAIEPGVDLDLRTPSALAGGGPRPTPRASVSRSRPSFGTRPGRTGTGTPPRLAPLPTAIPVQASGTVDDIHLDLGLPDDQPGTEAASHEPAAGVVPIPAPSFEAFYAAHRLPIGRALAFALGDVDLAAEATDEAFVRAYERWSSVSLGNPPAWVYRVAMNWALSILRRRKRGHHRFYDPPGDGQAMVEPAVHAALAALDPKHRSVVVCRYLLGWSVADTAAALHLREGTVKSRLSRATRVLQVRLHHLSPTEEPS